MFARHFLTLGLCIAATSPALAQAPVPAQEWPAVELAPGVVFVGDGSVKVEAGPGGVPVAAFWRPVLFREEEKYPVGGRVDCRVVAVPQPYSDEAYDLEATYAAEARQPERRKHTVEDRLRDYEENVRSLDIVSRRGNPHEHHVLSYIAVRQGDQLVQIRRNCVFIHHGGLGPTDYLSYVSRYTGLRFAAAPRGEAK